MNGITWRGRWRPMTGRAISARPLEVETFYAALVRVRAECMAHPALQGAGAVGARAGPYTRSPHSSP